MEELLQRAEALIQAHLPEAALAKVAAIDAWGEGAGACASVMASWREWEWALRRVSHTHSRLDIYTYIHSHDKQTPKAWRTRGRWPWWACWR